MTVTSVCGVKVLLAWKADTAATTSATVAPTLAFITPAGLATAVGLHSEKTMP